MNIPLRIKIIERYKTQSDFAAAHRLTDSFVSRVVQGRRELSPKEQHQWARALKCKPSDIFQEANS